MTIQARRRGRALYGGLLGLTIVLGLWARSSYGFELPILRELAGDFLWAMAVYWSFALFLPRRHPQELTSVSLLAAFAVEFSQLYRAEWIGRIREMKLGGLLLGYTFHWPDLVCYAAGAGAAGLIDHYLLRADRQSQ